MLTYITPRDRLLLKFLKPKVAAWKWLTRACRAVGVPVVRHEYLESVLASQIENFDVFSGTGGFEFEDGVYKLKLTTANNGVVVRDCYSLLEVATIAAFKFNAWSGRVVISVPEFATAALNSRSPSDFIHKYLEIRRECRLDHLRRVWIMYLTSPKDSLESQINQAKAIAGILCGNYESARAVADVGQETSEELALLGIDKKRAYYDVFDLMPALVLKDMELHRPHAYHLHTICNTEEELFRLLSGDMGFLRARMALMTAEQREYMFGAELGL